MLLLSRRKDEVQSREKDGEKKITNSRKRGREKGRERGGERERYTLFFSKLFEINCRHIISLLHIFPKEWDILCIPCFGLNCAL